jgi:hypothetical protein
VLLIILPLHEFLRVQQTVTDVSQKSVPVKQLPIQSLNPCRPWLVWNQCRRITAIHNMKRRGAQGGLEIGVVAVLSPSQPPQPSLWPITSKTTQVYPQNPVGYLRLAVSLGMERCAEAERHTSKFEELPQECTGEDWVAVTDDGAREPMETNDAVEEGLRNRHGNVGVAERNEVGILGETIHNGEHHRLAAHTWKSLYEVHGDVRPNRAGNVEGLQ